MPERSIWWLPLGRREYSDVWRMQKGLIPIRRRREIPDLFITVEHSHVITTGRSTDPQNLLEVQAPDGSGSVPVFETERGGDVTYHGPGQLVGYFIFDLRAGARDLHRFLRQVEQVQIELLRSFDVEAGRIEGKTGVWAGERKIGSVGIAVRDWVTYHGFALNISTDLRFFALINPCGFDASVMTSLSELTGRGVAIQDARTHVPTALSAVFDREVVRVAEKRLPLGVAHP
jgi:lipoate-protein ligase B